MLPRIAPSSFSVASSAVLIRAIARPFCSKRARAAAVTRGRAAGFLAVALRVDAALGAAVFRALALLTGGIDAPLSWNCSKLCHRGSHSSRPQGLARADPEVFESEILLGLRDVRIGLSLSLRPSRRSLHHPDVAMNFAMEVHGAQEFRWGPLVIAGEEITTRASVRDIYEHGGRGFYVFETVLVNKRGETVATGTWTDIVRTT